MDADKQTTESVEKIEILMPIEKQVWTVIRAAALVLDEPAHETAAMLMALGLKLYLHYPPEFLTGLVEGDVLIAAIEHDKGGEE